MMKKPTLFKKILTPENGFAENSAAEKPEDEPTSTTARKPGIPPPRTLKLRSKSHDPFEEDTDFGFTAGHSGDSSAEATPAPSSLQPESAANPPAPPETTTKPSADPTFAMPEEKQMSQPAPAPPPSGQDTGSELIRQLELRAIFGVDHEMDEREILERCNNLKGIRGVSRLAEGDAGTIDALKSMIGRIGFGDEPVRIFAGSVPVEFIREGGVALAVRTENGFAPGIRETLILVARELARMRTPASTRQS